MATTTSLVHQLLSAVDTADFDKVVRLARNADAKTLNGRVALADGEGRSNTPLGECILLLTRPNVVRATLVGPATYTESDRERLGRICHLLLANPKVESSIRVRFGDGGGSMLEYLAVDNRMWDVVSALLAFDRIRGCDADNLLIALAYHDGPQADMLLPPLFALSTDVFARALMRRDAKAVRKIIRLSHDNGINVQTRVVYYARGGRQSTVTTMVGGLLLTNDEEVDQSVPLLKVLLESPNVEVKVPRIDAFGYHPRILKTLLRNDRLDVHELPSTSTNFVSRTLYKATTIIPGLILLS